MGDHTNRQKYIPGDHYRICDRTGFKVRRSETTKEWTGQIVRDKSWETRHPQDYVRGVPDHQAVKEPRPEPADGVGGIIRLAFASDGAVGDTTVTVTATQGSQVGDTWRLTLDSGLLQEVTVSSFDGGTATGGFHVTVSQALKGTAEVNNAIANLSKLITATDGL